MVESLISSPSLDLENLSEYLEQFSGELEPYGLEPVLPAINRCFSAPKVLEILKCLQILSSGATDEPHRTWAQDTLDILGKMSPMAMEATLHLLKKGQSYSLKECLQMEFNLARNFLEKVPDLREGITSKLVRKQKSASWNPPTLEGVSERDVENLFSRNTSVLHHLHFANERDFKHYPHEDNVLPTTERIKVLIDTNRNHASVQQVIDEYCRKHHEKLGLRSRLTKVISRHVRSREQLEKEGMIAVSNLVWRDKEDN